MSAAIPAGLLALACFAWSVRVRRYRSVFRIPARRNDFCVCRGSHADFAVSAGPRGLELPPGTLGHGRTAFLVLEVSVTAAGRLLDPYIEVEHGNATFRQYFERGAAGRRHLNLSPAFQRADPSCSERIELRGRHIRWLAQAALMVFEPPPSSTGDTLIVAPHPDDSEIGAFGLYSQRRSWIVTVTSGERSPTDFSAVVPRGQDQSRWCALLRVWDSLSIPELGGVCREHRFNLAFPDAQLKEMHDKPTAAFRLACQDSLPREVLRSKNSLPELRTGAPGCTWGDLVDGLRLMLDTVRPKLLVCTHPLLDPHLDHVFTCMALADALRAGAHEPEQIFLYVVHANEVPLYPFGSAASVVSFPPWTHDGWVADSVYSHPLSEDTRCAKFFAVEAAHDLRVYSDSSRRPFRQFAALIWREISAFIAGMGTNPASFLRRAPRPNELYYVVSPDGFLELAQRARAAQISADGSRSR